MFRCFYCDKIARLKCACCNDLFCIAHTTYHRSSCRLNLPNNKLVEAEKSDLIDEIEKRIKILKCYKAETTKYAFEIITMTNKFLAEKIAKIDKLIISLIKLIPEGEGGVDPTEDIEKMFTTKIKFNPYPEITLSTSISSLTEDLIEEFSTFSEQWESFLNSNISECISLSLTQGDEYAIAGCSDHTVRVWNIKNKKLESTLIGHFELVSSVHVTSENKYIISGSWDKTVRVWSFKDKSLIVSFFGHENIVTAVSSFNDSNYALSISLDETFRVWDIAIKAQKFVIEFGIVLKSLFIRENGIYFLGSDNGMIMICSVYEDAEDPIFISVCESKLNSIVYYEYNNSEYLAIGSEDTKIYLLDILDCRITNTLEGHTQAVTSLCVNSPNRIIVSASSDRTIKVWSYQDISLVESTSMNFCPLSIVLSDDCKLFIAGDYIYCWEDLNGQSNYRLVSNNWFYYTTLLLSFDHRYAIYSNNTSIFVWNLLQGKLKAQFEENNINSITISDDNELLISAGHRLVVRQLDTDHNRVAPSEFGEITCVVISSDKSLIVCGSNNLRIYIWNFTFTHHNSKYFYIGKPLKSLAITHDNQKIVYCTDELKIKILNAITGTTEVNCLLEIDIEPKRIVVTRDILFCMICFDMNFLPRFVSLVNQNEVNDSGTLKDLEGKYREFFLERRKHIPISDFY